jgi:hypothetical protein
MNWFKPEVKVIEVDKGSRLEPMSPELRESLKTLQHNPAFQYLLTKLRYQRARVQNHLNNEADEKNMRYAQAGIFWLSWLEGEINAVTKAPRATPQSATPQEIDEFNKIAHNLEVVGAN